MLHVDYIFNRICIINSVAKERFKHFKINHLSVFLVNFTYLSRTNNEHYPHYFYAQIPRPLLGVALESLSTESVDKCVDGL
jgi:hypothetical protein